MKQHNSKLILLFVVFCLIAANTAFAHGNLYRLDMVYEGPVPTEFPAHIEFEVSEGRNCDHFRGSASADFDGVSMMNSVADGVVAIDDITIVDSTLVINYTVWGYDGASSPLKFKADTCFHIDINDTSDEIAWHTSCSQPIDVDVPAEGEGGGFFTILGGEGDCLPGGGGGDPGCPYDDKLFWLAGDFSIPCSSPGNVTFNVYDVHHDNNELKGTATGFFDGSGLSGVTNDDVAQLWGAYMDGGNLLVSIESFGFEHDPAHFKAHSSFEIVVEGCGTFVLDDFHTSCSQPIILNDPLPLSPAGDLTFVNYCGCEESTVSTESMDWGSLKSLYR